ncbi:hypothetical protein [uncultured Fusobacterium sp.]|uniref:hypothetical protein n=1 Tax=uncultured Fusobacterium sp. TaxID=159267 RepID=UPI002589BCAE|nr:hypothetical protein [uncultured Fusobacterium sp.]
MSKLESDIHEKYKKSYRNIICIPFAFKEKTNTGVNIQGNAYTVYLKNACVALCSAKHYNPEAEVVLATNIKINEIPKEITKILKKFQVKIEEIPFDNFVFDKNYLWSLAFYKLCVLKYYSLSNYKNICYMDTDVFVQNNIGFIWEECDQNILLYDINHGLQIQDYKILCEEYEKFTGEKKYITHYGGEFFAASLENTKIFVKSLEDVYQKMLKDNFITTKGDEFLVSVSADKLQQYIKNTGGYIYIDSGHHQDLDLFLHVMNTILY